MELFWYRLLTKGVVKDRSNVARGQEKVKGKEKAKVDSKEREERSLVKNKHRILNGSLQRVVLGGPKEEEARRVLRN